MNAVLDQVFSAPVDTDRFSEMVARRDAHAAAITGLAEIVNGEEYAAAASYFLRAIPSREMRYGREVAEIFDQDKAIAYLDACFWKTALAETDVYEVMPQARKDEWNQVIEERKTPPFNDDNVRATIGDLLLSRTKFAAERADGLFRRLSREHVTNCPEGFGKRFILGHAFSYGSADHSASGYLDDLRDLVARFMGRPVNGRIMGSRSTMDFARRGNQRGQWVEMDGGAIRIRCYLKGTMHIEVHPDLAWRLNQLLHELHPMAIPSRFRTPPKRTKKMPEVFDRLLSFGACATISDMRVSSQGKEWLVTTPYGFYGKAVAGETKAVIDQLGGVQTGGGWLFDFDPGEVLAEVAASGRVPDIRAYQFYPTPPHIVEAMIEEAEVKPYHACLEPSAGIGAIAEHLPEPTCIEISALHCRILEGVSGNVIQADFLEWADEQDMLLGSYDRIVMNPPYSEGRAIAHLEAALTMLAPEGRLVALLPSTYQKRDMPGGGRWGATLDRFPGTSISVSIYVVDGPKA